MENDEDRNDNNQQILQAEEFNFQESVLFDKSILTLAGGVFGLSLTFIKQIPHTNHIWLLCYSWILYVCSILTTLISMLIGSSASREKVKYLEENDNDISYNDSYASLTLCLNICSIVLFIAGSFLLLFFVVLNLK